MAGHSQPGDGKGAVAYLRAMLGLTRWRFAAVTLAMVASRVTEGFGLLLLVPLLGLLGVQGGGDGEVNIYSEAAAFLQTLHLPLNLPMLLGIFVLLIFMQGAFRYWRVLMGAKLNLMFTDGMRERLYRALLFCDWRTYSTLHSADIMHVVTNDIERLGSATHFLLQALTQTLMILAYVVVAWHLSVSVTLLSLFSALVLFLLFRSRNRHAERLGEALSRSSQYFYQLLDNILNGMKLVKSQAQEREQLDNLIHATREVRERELEFERSNSLLEWVYRSTAAVMLAVFVYLALERFGMAVADMLVMILVFARMLPQVGALQRSYHHFLHTVPAYENTASLLERISATEPPVVEGSTAELVEAIALKNVGFSYDRLGERPTLAEIDANIPARSTTAIIGPSGAGKSTLVDLVTGLLAPVHGEVLIDSEPLAGTLQGAWRQRIAYVPQEVFLFPDTIRANLLFGNDGLKDERLWLCLEMAAAADFVRGLPDGLDTVVGERGIRLSGGERQRIALARALLRDPLLLILDEATSAVDRENERRIQLAIERLHGQLTIVIIAHRLATVQHADQIFVLREGRLTEQGDWQSLMANPDGYLGSHRRDIEQNTEFLL